MSKHTLTIEQDENGIFVGEINNLPACYTQASTIPKLIERMMEVTQGSMHIVKNIQENKLQGLRLHMMVDYA